MKNKKLIATVASLCLVLVAVVAAVIGVLAAAQQKVTNQIKVGYTAVANVYATVSLNGKTEQTDYGTEVSTNFVSAEQSTEKNLAFAYDAGLTLSESASGLTNKYALYRFKFQNQNPTHALEVTLKYTEGAAGTNVRLFWVQSDSESWTPSLAYASDGSLSTNAPLATDGFAVTSGTEVKVYNHASGSVDSAIANNGGIQYIYLVVAVVNLNADASYDLNGNTNTLLFTLDGYKAPAQGN